MSRPAAPRDPESTVTRPRRRQRRRDAAARRRLLACAALVALVTLGGVRLALGGARGGASHARHELQNGHVELRVGTRPLAAVVVPSRARGGSGRSGRAALARAVFRKLPPTQVVSSGSAKVVYRLDRRAALRRLERATGGGAVTVPREAVAASVSAPVIAQKLRNNCEAAALEVLLATVGVRVGQLRLQAELPRSRPLDPQGRPPTEVWGDPARGFVGRPDGGGPAGGFGVYEGPIRRVAARHDVRLRDLTGAEPAAVYRRLLAGHAVMTWVGLAAGPYGQWRSPTGRPIKVNFNEHTVVLTGVSRTGLLTIVNPLRGTRERWSKPKFEAMWARLGRRALSS